MNIAIIGIGSIGSYVSAMLAHNTDHQLHLLARSNYQTISEQGITFEESSEGNILKTHRFTVFDDISTMPTCDLVILAVREAQLASLLPKLQSICLKHTKIVCLQNGINFEKQVQDALPNHPLYSGTCWIKVTTVAQGVIRHEFGNTLMLGRYGKCSSADKSQESNISDNIVRKLFSEANLKCVVVDNIQSTQLTKLALNVPFFVLIAREGKTASEILADTSLNSTREELQQEIIEACQLYGCSVDGVFLKKTLDSLRQSLVQSAESSQKLAQTMRLELPGNAGALLELFESKGIQLPKLRTLYDSFY